MLAKIKLNSIATLLSQALKNMDISHKELQFWERKINMKGWKIFQKVKMKNICAITLAAKQCLKLWD